MHQYSVEASNFTRQHATTLQRQAARRRGAIALWTAQVLATVAAVAACAAKIESILFTGPSLAVIGLILAIVTQPLRSWRVLIYSLSGPFVAAFCAALIVVFHWGPGEAEEPILAILFIYAFLSILTALFVFPEILQWSALPPTGPPLRWRYSLRSLLMVTTALCIAAPALRFLFVNVRRSDTIIFSLFVLVTMTLAGIALCAFVAGRRGDQRQGTD
jgi:hypothetical protein